jgi:hypothetical protein
MAINSLDHFGDPRLSSNQHSCGVYANRKVANTMKQSYYTILDNTNSYRQQMNCWG